MFVQIKLCLKFAPLLRAMVHGVIGNTPVFGTVIQGSSPCGPTAKLETRYRKVLGFFMPYCVLSHTVVAFT